MNEPVMIKKKEKEADNEKEKEKETKKEKGKDNEKDLTVSELVGATLCLNCPSHG